MVKTMIDRYGPAAGFFALGIMLMAGDFAIVVMDGGSPITPEIYGPAVHSIPAMAWVGVQFFCASIVFIAAFLTGKPRAIGFIVGGFLLVALFAIFSVMAQGAPSGSVLAAGSRWPVGSSCLAIFLLGWFGYNGRE